MRYPTFAKKRETAVDNTLSPGKPAPDRLRVGAVNDSSEHEADRVANQVMAGGTANRDWSFSRMSVGAPATSGIPSVEGKANSLSSQQRGDAVETALAPPVVHDVLHSAGQPLDKATREFFERRFGRDLGGVRVHSGEQAAESARAVQAQAYTVGRDIVLGQATDHRLIAHELVHTLQPERDNVTALRRQPAKQPAAQPEMKLVDDFAAKFPAAANLIKPNPAAMKLIKEAFDAGATFGGFAEDGPAKEIGRAYTVGSAVYVLKAHIDPPVMAMRDFLFELNNAIRAPRVAALITAATKGAKTDTAAAKQHAYDRAEGEVEGMLRLGEVWFETKAKSLGTKAHDFDKYDNDFYLAEYKSFKDRLKTKDDIVKDVLARKYDSGTLRGKTVEQFYIEEYQGLAK